MMGEKTVVVLDRNWLINPKIMCLKVVEFQILFKQPKLLVISPIGDHRVAIMIEEVYLGAHNLSGRP